MKNVINLMAVMATVIVVFAACDKESIVAADGLPKDAQAYINQHFPDHEILQVVKERDDLKTSFDVFLSGGYKLEFNKNGKVLGIEGNNKLPDSVIPAKILAYVNDNYAAHFIIDWELDDRGQEVKLSNRLELKFDKNDNFLRVDM